MERRVTDTPTPALAETPELMNLLAGEAMLRFNALLEKHHSREFVLGVARNALAYFEVLVATQGSARALTRADAAYSAGQVEALMLAFYQQLTGQTPA
jgi:hypothetical protein